MRKLKQEKENLHGQSLSTSAENWDKNSGLLALRIVLITLYQEYPLSCTTLLDASLLP